MKHMTLLREEMQILQNMVEGTASSHDVMLQIQRVKAAFTVAMRQVQLDVATAALENTSLAQVIKDRTELEATLKAFSALRNAAQLQARANRADSKVLH